jgi:hypothetical protein
VTRLHRTALVAAAAPARGDPDNAVAPPGRRAAGCGPVRVAAVLVGRQRRGARRCTSPELDAAASMTVRTVRRTHGRRPADAGAAPRHRRRRADGDDEPDRFCRDTPTPVTSPDGSATVPMGRAGRGPGGGVVTRLGLLADGSPRPAHARPPALEPPWRSRTTRAGLRCTATIPGLDSDLLPSAR